jgi:MFS family permease
MPELVAQPGRFGVLGHRAFRVYWLGQAVSLVGTWMQLAAAAWVIVELTASKTSIAAISFVASLPVLGLAIHGGGVADRHDRRKVLIVTQVAFAAIAFVYAGLLAAGLLSVTLLYVLAIASGVATAYDLPVQQAIIPDLVPRRDIPGAIALYQVIFHGSRLIGPALAAALLTLAAPALAFVANGVSFFAVIYSLAIIPSPPRPENRPGAHGFAEGMRYILGHRDVRVLIGFAGLTTTFVFPFLIVFMAVYAKTAVGGGAGTVGLCMSASGAGALLGALALLRVAATRRGPTLIAACALAAIFLGAISFARHAAPLIAAIGAMSFCVSLALGIATTILQVTVPTELRGRVMGVYRMMWNGLIPSAALVLGVVADDIGLRATLRLMAGAYALLALPWLTRARLPIASPNEP